MLLRTLSSDQSSSIKTLVPIAMALLATGSLLLGLSVGWHVILKSSAGAWTESDFLRGLCFGLAIGLEICGVVIATRAVRWSKRASGAGNTLPR